MSALLHKIVVVYRDMDMVVCEEVKWWKCPKSDNDCLLRVGMKVAENQKLEELLALYS